MADAASVASDGLVLSVRLAPLLESSGGNPPCGVNMDDEGERPRKLKPVAECTVAELFCGEGSERNTVGDSRDEDACRPVSDALDDDGSNGAGVC